jgi:hypothetical protein
MEIGGFDFLLLPLRGLGDETQARAPLIFL